MSESIDPRVLQELDRWLRNKGGKVQSRLITEFYAKHPANKPALQNRLYMLADMPQSSVHLVLGKGPSNTEMEYLELKDFGNKPYRKIATTPTQPAQPQPVSLPTFVDAIGDSSYAIVRDPQVVKAVLQEWSSVEPHAVDLKGDVRREGRLSLIQICNRYRQVLMIDFVDNLSVAEQSGLKAYLEDPNRLKIILDSARPVDALRGILGIEVRNVFDISRGQIIAKQRRGEYIEGSPAPTLVSLTRELGFPFYKVAKPEESWFKRPLNKQQLEYSLTGVIYNVAIYERVMRMVQEAGAVQEVMEESARHMVSLRDVQFIEDDYGTDWSCTSCGFKNFSKRTTCRKCDHARPEQYGGKKVVPGKYDVKSGSKSNVQSRPPVHQQHPHHINGAAPVVAPAPAPAAAAAEPLDDIEDEAIKMAMELSLKEERDRQERVSKEQPKDQSKAKPLPGKQDGKPVSDSQKSVPSPAKTAATRPSVAVPVAPKPSPTPPPALPTLGTDMFSGSSFFGTGSASFDQSTRSDGPKPQIALPNITDEIMTDIAERLVANVVDDSETGRMAIFSSFGSGLDSSNGSTWGNQPSLFSNSLPGPLLGTPLYGVRPSPTASSTPATKLSPPGVPPPQPQASVAPARQQSPPLTLSEDEMVLLSTDVGALLEEVKLPESLERPVMEAAIRAGARMDIIEAPLPVLAKELEKLEITVGQRASILKGIHARKQKSGRA